MIERVEKLGQAHVCLFVSLFRLFGNSMPVILLPVRQSQEKIIRVCFYSVCHECAYTVHERQLAQTVPFPFGHGFQWLVFSSESSAAQEPEEVSLYHRHCFHEYRFGYLNMMASTAAAPMQKG